MIHLSAPSTFKSFSSLSLTGENREMADKRGHTWEKNLTKTVLTCWNWRTLNKFRHTGQESDSNALARGLIFTYIHTHTHGFMHKWHTQCLQYHNQTRIIKKRYVKAIWQWTLFSRFPWFLSNTLDQTHKRRGTRVHWRSCMNFGTCGLHLNPLKQTHRLTVGMHAHTHWRSD